MQGSNQRHTLRVETELSDYQALLLERVMREITEKQVNGRRWNKAVKECSRLGDRGWSRTNVEYAKTLVGKDGDSVRLVGETWDDRIFYNGKQHEVVASTEPVWHHYFPEGNTASQIVGDEKWWVVSDRMLPHTLKFPRKYKAPRNESATYLGDASGLSAELRRYLVSREDRPLFQRRRKTRPE